MIDFRYHLVSLVSVFLALAVGIVLGAGPLKGTISDTLSSQVEQLRKDKADLHTQLETAQAASDNRDAFTAAVMPTLVAQQLGGTSVVLVTVPGADTDAVKPLTQALQDSGATVTGRVDVKDAWTDPAKLKDRDAAVRTLAPTPVTATPSPGGAASGAQSAAPSGSSSRASDPARDAPALTALLARAVLTDQVAQSGALDQTARSLIDGLRKAGLIDLGADVTGRATEAVMLVPGVTTVAGGQPSASPTSYDPTVSWASLATGLDARSNGVVVVGPASSATQGGALATVRSLPGTPRTVSTVDTGGTPMGDVSTVLALREQALGGAGNYGFVGKVDGPLPARAGVAKP
jgi:hypothetical protein